MKLLRKTLEIVTILLFTGIILLTLLQILTRYFSLATLPWTEEVARLLLIWATFFAVTIIIGRRDHINIDFFYKRLPKKFQFFDDILIEICFFLFSVVAMYFGYLVSKAASTDFNTSLKFSSMLFYLPIPISGFFNIFFITSNIISLVKNRGRQEVKS